jgi:hypothetical protein
MDLTRKLLLMSGNAPKDSDTPLTLLPADGYAAMFADAPPPTAEDLRDLQPSGQCLDLRKPGRADADPPRPPIASVA